MNKQELGFLDQVYNKLKLHLEQLEDPNLRVRHHETPETIINKFDFSLGDSNEEGRILEKIDYYLENSVKTNSKQFHNQLFAGNHPVSLAGEMISAVLNNSNYTFEVSPLATMMELELINKMGSLAGYKNPYGTFLTGGSNANLVAMMVARQAYFPEVKTKGVSALGELCIFVSELAHYSYEKAANVLGIGLDNVIYVKTVNGIIDKQSLIIEIEKAKNEGKKPFMIGATCCTTELGKFDDLKMLRKVADEFALWLHADAAWGGSILLSEKYRYLLDGIEKTDSLSWDPHKMMQTNLICSVAIFNNKEQIFKETTYTSKADYIFHEHKYMNYDLGNFSLQCGKKIDSLKLWLLWKALGNKGLGERINYLFEAKDYVVELIKSDSDIELLDVPDSLNVNFRYKKENVELNEYNKKIRDHSIELGKTLCNYCRIEGKFSFRLIINNPNKEFSDYVNFFDILKQSKTEIDKTLNG